LNQNKVHTLAKSSSSQHALLCLPITLQSRARFSGSSHPSQPTAPADPTHAQRSVTGRELAALFIKKTKQEAKKKVDTGL